MFYSWSLNAEIHLILQIISGLSVWIKTGIEFGFKKGSIFKFLKKMSCRLNPLTLKQE